MHDDDNIGYTATPPADDPTAVAHLLNVRIDARGDEVVIDFGTMLAWIALPPDEARALAIAIFNSAAAVQGRGPIIDTVATPADDEAAPRATLPPERP